MNYTIDATDKKVGRIATEVAVLLMGKNRPDFEKNVVAPVKVTIVNASKLSIDLERAKEIDHERYSGYPGGFSSVTLAELVAKKGYGEALKLSIYGMLPGNKLRPLMMKNITISE